MPASPEERARWFRAMWAYSCEEQGPFIAAIGHGATANHIRKKGAPAPSEAMLEAAAEHVGWSQEFARRGPAAIADPDDPLTDRVETLERQVLALFQQLGSLQVARPP